MPHVRRARVSFSIVCMSPTAIEAVKCWSETGLSSSCLLGERAHAGRTGRTLDPARRASTALGPVTSYTTISAWCKLRARKIGLVLSYHQVWSNTISSSLNKLNYLGEMMIDLQFLITFLGL